MIEQIRVKLYIIKRVYLFFNLLLKFLCKLRKVNVIFFFPYYHTGGAEQVHLDIVKSIPIKKSILIFTNYSKNDHFLLEFTKCSYIFDFKPFMNNSVFKYLFLKSLKFFGTNSHKTVFGCNNTFFYDTLKCYNTNVTKIDLLHAFSYPDLGGMEIYSVPMISLLDKRVVINMKTYYDYKDLYENNGIEEIYLSKIEIIPNSCSFKEQDIKYDNRIDNTLNLLYCGRIAKEKRVHLVPVIAENLKDCKLKIYGFKEIEVENIEPFYCGVLKGNDELSVVYTYSDVLLITSYREGFPLVVADAMWHGVICICTDVGGINEHIQNGINGFLVPNYLDEDIIINDFVSIINNLKNNFDLRNKIVQNAQNYARNNFSYMKFRDKYLQLLGF